MLSFPRFARVAAVAVTATLALAGAALATPTPPLVHPIPATVAVPKGGEYPVIWDASTFDDPTDPPYATYYAYRVDVVSYPTGRPDLASSRITHPFISCCSYQLAVTGGRHYVMWVRAEEYGWLAWAYSLFVTREFDVVSQTYIG
jgi:hypothetical protein